MERKIRNGEGKIMKVVTEPSFIALVKSLISDKKKKAELLEQPPPIINRDELLREIDDSLRGNWAVQTEPVFKFSRGDVNAVASRRFFSGTGNWQKLARYHRY